MKILHNNKELNKALTGQTNINFVPTMGGLHQGHISLINKSQNKSGITVVSIFINPKQFNDKKDFKKYPRNIQKDLKILKKLRVNYLYLPKYSDVYYPKQNQIIKLNKNEKILCAKFRKGHFEGVLDVMDRLTEIIKPKKIFMGEKDFQQFYLVKKFIEKKFHTKVIGCKTIREKNYLAMSTRNQLLSKNQFDNAGKIALNLKKFKNTLKNKVNLQKLILDKCKILKKKFRIKIEYLELRNIFNLRLSKSIKNSKLFIAYKIGTVRLIDNF